MTTDMTSPTTWKGIFPEERSICTFGSHSAMARLPRLRSKSDVATAEDCSLGRRAYVSGLRCLNSAARPARG
jgi:hypothetical protein